MSSTVRCTRKWTCEGRGCSRVATVTQPSTIEPHDRPLGWRMLSLDVDLGTVEFFEICPDCVARFRALLGSAPVPSTNDGAPYTVRWGYYAEHSQGFENFDSALKRYAALQAERGRPIMEGAGADGAPDGTDGLTYDERTALWEIP